jgi:hypothetical protein
VRGTRTALAAAALGAGLVAAASARADDPTTTDIRCVVVSDALSRSADADVQKLGAVGLFYFWGRLEGRGATANIAHRLTDESAKMTADDLKAQARICAAIFAAGTQALQSQRGASQDRSKDAGPAS